MSGLAKILPPGTRAPSACLVVAGVAGINAAASFDGWARAAETLSSAGAVIGVAMLVAVLLHLLTATQPSPSTRGMRPIHVHAGHGTKTAAWHEGGHKAVCEAAGGRVSGAQIFPDGSGICWVQLPDDASVVDEVALDVAGAVAAGTDRGCGSDFAYMEAALKTLPRSQRGAAKQAGYAQARKVINGFWSDGGTAHTARILLRKGRL